jgi:hypothetical protein
VVTGEGLVDSSPSVLSASLEDSAPLDFEGSALLGCEDSAASLALDEVPALLEDSPALVVLELLPVLVAFALAPVVACLEAAARAGSCPEAS